MTVLRLRRLLLGFVSLCGLASAAILIWACAWPIPNSSPPDVASLALPRQATKQIAAASASESLMQQFSVHSKKRLRQPLHDPPSADSKATAKTVKPAALPNVELLGTITDGAQTWAMLQTGPSQLELCKVGDSVRVGAALLEVVTVEANGVVLRHQGSDVRVSLKQPPRTLGL